MRKIEEIKADIAEWEERPMDDTRAHKLHALRGEYKLAITSGISLSDLESACAAIKAGTFVALGYKPLTPKEQDDYEKTLREGYEINEAAQKEGV